MPAHSHNLSAAATLREQNDSPDPTGEDVWPLDRDGRHIDFGDDAPHAAGCYWTAQVTDSVINADRHDSDDEVTVAAEGCAADRLRGVHVEQCPVCLHEMGNDEGILCDHCEEPTGVESCAIVNGPGGVFVYHLRCYDEVYWGRQDDGQEADTDAGTIPLWKQALWLARHIEDLHSPRPDVVGDDELRGMTLIRVLGIGADEHGDEVFLKGSPELRKDRAEEWSDGEFYDLVDRFGRELNGAG